MNKMKKYSNVPKDFFSKKMERKKDLKCVFMENTGKLALQHKPCLGNLVICRNPDFYGSFFTEKQCSPLWCKYYRKQED